MNCRDQIEEIVRLSQIREAAFAVLRIVQDCSFPTSGCLPGGSKRGKTTATHHRPQQAHGRPNNKGIIDSPLVTDQREAYELLSTLFFLLASLRKIEESDENLLQVISVFMNALRRRRSLARPAKALCKSLRESYRLDTMVDLSLKTKILLDHHEYYNSIPCFPGAAAYVYYYDNRERPVLPDEIVKEVPACKGTVDSLDGKLDKLHPDQRKRLRGNKKGGRFFACD